MARRTISDGQRAKAEAMLANGSSYGATARATGISATTLTRDYPGQGAGPGRPKRDSVSQGEPSQPSPADGAGLPPGGGKPRPDPPPRARPRPSRKAGPTDEQLEQMVRKIAKAPAIPAALWLHCGFCAEHFRTSAGPLAAELVAVSREDRDLREILEWMYTSWRKYAWAGMLASWLGVPLVHHALPAGLYGIAGPLMGMPPRTPAREHRHQARPMPPASGPWAPSFPFPEPFSTPEPWPQGAPAPAPDVPFADQLAGMDVSQILDMAAGLGIELPADIASAITPEMVAQAASLMGENGRPETTAVHDAEPDLTFEQQERDLAAAAAEAAAAQAAALAADPDTI